jgi:glutathione reductase (NADPH)
MNDFDYDLYVIGAGSGGVRASRMAASYGARVAVAEERYLGGTCVNVGCIPKKLFAYGAHYAEEFEDARSYGWHVEPSGFDWPTLIANKNTEIERLNGIYERLLQNAGVEIHSARATIMDPHRVRVGDTEYTCKYILVATGSWPTVPEFPGDQYAITSNEAFYLDALPRHAVIVGGGYIAVEFAGIFAGLGVETTLVYRGPMFMRGFDDDVRSHLADEMTNKGINLKFNATVREISENQSGTEQSKYTVTLNDGSVIAADIAMFATGRHPNSTNLGLEDAGVEVNDRGAIVIDQYFQTSLPSIYALGDVVDRMQLTPVALAEGMAVARTLFLNEPTSVDYADIATAVFSQPNVATVGLTEEQARERNITIDVFKSSFRELKLTLTPRQEKTFMKMIVDRDTNRVLGVHMVGAHAGEIIQGLAIAIRAGATKADFDRTIGIHPTAAEEFVTMRTAEPDPEPTLEPGPETSAATQ